MKEWERLNIPRSTYYWRTKNRHALETDGRQHRFSGRQYDNPPEKIAALKSKYRNGVTADIMKELFLK